MPYRTFAHHILARASDDGLPKLVGTVSNAGRTASGVMLTGRTDGGGLWTCTFGNILIRTADQLRYWGAMERYLAEGVRPVIVPFCLRRTMPAPTVNGIRLVSYDAIPHSDGAYFSDGSGYYQPVVNATLVADRELRAVSLDIDIDTPGSEIRGGEYLSFDYGGDLSHRLHQIYDVRIVSGVYRVKVEPPLRADTAAGAVPDFSDPKLVMQLTGAGAMSLPLEQRQHGKGSISFVESFLPEPE